MNYLDQHAKEQLENLIDEQEKIIKKANTEKARLEQMLAKVLENAA